MKSFAFALTVLAVLPLALLAQAPVPTNTAAGLGMDDQFEQRHDLTAYRGQVVVLLYGDRRGNAANRTLGERVFVHFHPTAQGMTPADAPKAPVRPVAGQSPEQPAPQVACVPVACIGPVPNVVKTLIRSQFRKGSPSVPVWLDYENQMQQRFGLVAGTANLVVIDALGRPRMKLNGEPDAAQFKRLVSVIEGLRAEALGANITIGSPSLKP